MYPTMRGGKGGGKGGGDLQRFIEENDIDEKAAQVLRGESRAVQRDVMEKGSLTNASNPSSALMVRIRRAKSDEQMGWGGGMEMIPMMMGGGKQGGKGGK